MRSATMMLAAMCNATATLAQASVSPRLRSLAGAARVGRRASRLRLPRAVPTSVDASETTRRSLPAVLIVVECDGVLCDVHLGGQERSTRRSRSSAWRACPGARTVPVAPALGGTAYEMIERYFHSAGPTPELRDPVARSPTNLGTWGTLGSCPRATRTRPSRRRPRRRRLREP